LQVVAVIIGIYNIATLGENSLVPTSAIGCREHMKDETGLELVVFAYLGCLVLFGGAALFRMNDAMLIHIELKLLFGMIAIVFAILVFANSSTHFTLYCSLMAIAGDGILLVQTTFPVILCHLKSYSFSNEFQRRSTDMMSSNAFSKSVVGSQVQTLQDAINSMMSTIHVPHKRDAFMRFLEREVAVESLLFIEACEKFERSIELGKSDHGLVKSIMENFIVATAPSCVNLPHQTRDQIIFKFEEMKKNEGSPIDPVLFKLAKNNIVDLLVADSFRRFQMTSEFVELEATQVTMTKPQAIEAEPNLDECQR
jgi:hypothetical protein